MPDSLRRRSSPRFDITVATTAPLSRPRFCWSSAISAISWSPSVMPPHFVGDDDPVGIAVEREADVGAAGEHGFAQQLAGWSTRSRR